MKGKVMLFGLLCLLGLGAGRPAVSAAVSGPIAKAVVSMPGSSLEREVRHELLMLPYYSVFDHLAFQIDGGTVILSGEVTRPTLKDDAERVIKRIEGVEQVVNKIHVLPVSPFDDQIRMAAFRAIYGTPELNRYAHQAVPPIHIIVENGRITLKGVVANESDRNLAYVKALEVPGAFSVTNHLAIEN
jgi:hyperosmotically inducible protein